MVKSMRYTKYDEEWVNHEIQLQLDVITGIIRKLVYPSNLRSIILSGGFARGEGSVIIEGKKVTPLKDYDIFTIVKVKPPNETIKLIHDECYKALNMNSSKNRDFKFSDFVIDINFTTEKRLILRPDIFTYELKTTGKVLWGEDIRHYIPWSIKDIPSITTLRFLFEKATGLIAHTADINMLDMQIKKEKKLNFIYECYKTYVEVCTVLCFYMGCYEPSYETRSKLLAENLKLKFPEIYRLIPDLPDKVEYCTQFKLKPDLKQVEIEDPVELWFKTRDDLLVIMQHCIQVDLNIEIKDWNYSYYKICSLMGNRYHYWLSEVILSKLFIYNKKISSISNLMIQFAFNLKYIFNLYCEEKILRLNLLVQPYSVIIGIFISSPLILMAFNKDNSDSIASNEAAMKIKAFYMLDVMDGSFDNLRKGYLKSYYLYGGPK